ncbi:hypothetical protein GCM10022219_06590 [Microbacterium oryzae]
MLRVFVCATSVGGEDVGAHSGSLRAEHADGWLGADEDDDVAPSCESEGDSTGEAEMSEQFDVEERYPEECFRRLRAAALFLMISQRRSV